MKKLLGILVLGLLWCNVGFALTQQSAINQYLSDRKLDLMEGIWGDNNGDIKMVAKTGGSYTIFYIQHRFERSGHQAGHLQKGNENYYYGSGESHYGGRPHPCSLAVTVNRSSARVTCTDNKSGALTWSWFRIWPGDITSHNTKFEKKEKPKDKFTPSSGTAFFVTNKGHLVTNYHVVEGCKNKSKISFEDKEIKVKLLAKDKYLDLALLKADIKNKNFIKISNKAPKKLQRIIAAGYPLGKELSDDLKFTSGIVSSLKGLEDDSTRIQIDAALNPGNSGGPIVDEKNGELVAVAVSGLTKTQSINFGIKAGSVKNFLESNQITSLSQSNYSFGSVDLSDILEKATVYTFCK